MHRLRGLFGLHLLPQGFAVVRWTVEKTWLRWSQKYRIRAVCRELMRTASPVDMVFMTTGVDAGSKNMTSRLAAIEPQWKRTSLWTRVAPNCTPFKAAVRATRIQG